MTRVNAAQHGTRSKYNTGCRCVECREANAIYARNRPKPPKGCKKCQEPIPPGWRTFCSAQCAFGGRK